MSNIKDADLRGLRVFIEKSFDKYAEKSPKIYALMSK